MNAKFAAFALTFAGAIPFVAGAAAAVWSREITFGQPTPMWVTLCLTFLPIYAPVIGAYMAGVFWGFAAAAPAQRPFWYVLAIAPALVLAFGLLWARLDMLYHPIRGQEFMVYSAYFPALLVVDRMFARAGLTPDWWMSLRVPVTVIVTTCLGTALGAFLS